MAFAAGTRIGPYEVVAPLGAGGMGEVYRARDTQLKREVALKVLPEAFTNDADRLARFRREAELLATLNHPHIAAIYGLEKSGPVTAIVLELVDGETMADVIARGPIPIEDALPIACQIAEALEAAHDRGVIHRDLKPANIKLTPEGAVKILDFGLAKLAGPADEPSGAPAVTMSPTLSLHATHAGVILGTAAYMSPEQARGKPVDRRTDIWSFGCVLFEMLTGRRTFETGETISDAVAAVLKSDPAWQALPAATPGPVRDLLRRCLTKDPRSRMRDIGDARIVIEETIASPGALELRGAATGHARAPVWRRAIPWAFAALAAALAVVAWAPWKRLPAPPVMRLTVEVGADASLITGTGAAAFLSSDGTMLAFAAAKGDVTQLYVRRLDQLQATPLTGTEGARNAFFSPDGAWIAYFAGGKLKKVPVTGGPSITLCDAENDRGGTWSDDGTIVFAPNTRSGLFRVADTGGTPQPLTTLTGTSPPEITHRWPHALPGGRGVLFMSSTISNLYEDAEIALQPFDGGPRKTVHGGGYAPQYAGTGHLLYAHQGTLFSIAFDLDRLETSGAPVPVMDGFVSTPNNGASQLALAASGAAVYVAGAGLSGGTALSLIADGKTQVLRGTPGAFLNMRFSPDGRRLAMELAEQQYDVWTYEWERDAMTRLTFDVTQDARPVWSPSGRHLAFSSQRGDKATFNLYWQNADGTGEAHRLTESRNAQFAGSWHPSGTFLAFVENDPANAADIRILPLEGDEATGWKAGTPTTFVATSFSDQNPEFSPDGRWLAYHSNESGRREVYVRPFPGPGGRWQVSTAGGGFPAWSRTAKEIVFQTPDGQMMAVTYAADAEAFTASAPRLWSEARPLNRGDNLNFALHPDGRRLAIVTLPQGQPDRSLDQVTMILNLSEELRRSRR